MCPDPASAGARDYRCDRGKIERGFTLIELVACIVVIGILAAIAAPRFFDTQTFTGCGYANELVSSLRYAQRIALASGCPVQVTIGAADYEARQLANRVGHNVCTGGWDTPVLRPDGTPLTGVAPRGVTADPAAVVIFRADGVPLASATSISVVTITVAIDAATGRVSVR